MTQRSSLLEESHLQENDNFATRLESYQQQHHKQQQQINGTTNDNGTTTPTNPTRIPHDETPEVFRHEAHERLGYSWRIADFDSIPARSRDGSVHATDEVFNAASHLSAFLLSILGSSLLISRASEQGDPWKIVSFSLYGASLMFLFLASTLHHSLVGSPQLETILRRMDYMAIYPLIAGTFTPLCLVFYHASVVGWTFCSVVWGISLLAMVCTGIYFVQIPKWLSMTMYITLGWMGGCMTYWLIPVLGWKGFGLFFFGGVCYTGGGYIYMTEHPNPWPGRFGFHEIWHLAVMAGAFTHWCLMYFYVLPEFDNTQQQSDNLQQRELELSGYFNFYNFEYHHR